MARKLSPLVALPPLIFVGLAALFFVGLGREDPDALPSALIEHAAPTLTVTPMTGAEPLTDAMLRAPGVKLVNFWASWCAPCRAEHPNLVMLAAEGVTIYGVNYKDAPADALGFLAELGNPFAALGADRSGRTGIDWGVYGVPETFVIDGTGHIVLRFAGPMTQAAIEARIRPAMAEAARH